MPVTIDLKSPMGNAFMLLGAAERIAKQLEWSKEERETLLAKMKAGNYDHLVNTMAEAFGDLIVWEGRDEDDDGEDDDLDDDDDDEFDDDEEDEDDDLDE